MLNRIHTRKGVPVVITGAYGAEPQFEAAFGLFAWSLSILPLLCVFLGATYINAGAIWDYFWRRWRRWWWHRRWSAAWID